MSTPAASLTPTPPPAVLRTPRLELRTHDITNAERIFACIDADRERLRRFLPWVDHLLTVEDERAYITRTQGDWTAGRMFDYGVFLREGDTYVGNVGVHHLRWDHAGCEIGYWLVGTAEGQGLMTEAVQALETAMFGLGMHRIEIRTSPLNHRSAGVPERLGYPLEGTLRDVMIERGAFRDVRVYAKLRGA